MSYLKDYNLSDEDLQEIYDNLRRSVLPIFSLGLL